MSTLDWKQFPFWRIAKKIILFSILVSRCPWLNYQFTKTNERQLIATTKLSAKCRRASIRNLCWSSIGKRGGPFKGGFHLKMVSPFNYTNMIIRKVWHLRCLTFVVHNNLLRMNQQGNQYGTDILFCFHCSIKIPTKSMLLRQFRFVIVCSQTRLQKDQTLREEKQRYKYLMMLTIPNP